MARLGYIQVARICNQNCIFCSNPPNGRLISFAKFKKTIDYYVKQKYDGIILTGGEPTLHPDLNKFIEYANSRNIHPRIITNAQKIANIKYLSSLISSGLNHIHISLYSCDPEIQTFLTRNKKSFKNIKKALDNFKKLSININININTAINKYNAGHLSKNVEWIVKNYSFVTHFVWNNLDPLMMGFIRKGIIPELIDFEAELWKAVRFLEKNDKTFRVERVPLCYMDGFEQYSTETRIIVKNEERAGYFLDERDFFKKTSGSGGGKTDCCNICHLNDICDGLYEMDKYYSSKDLYPVFIDKEKIIKDILS